MIKLNDKTLRKKLNEINSNPKLKEIYSSKWHRIVKFLHGNIGLKIAGVSPKGSQAKGTSTRKSDLDVIFCTSLDKNKKSILNLILQKARNAFGKVAKVNLG